MLKIDAASDVHCHHLRISQIQAGFSFRIDDFQLVPRDEVLPVDEQAGCRDRKFFPTVLGEGISDLDVFQPDVRSVLQVKCGVVIILRGSVGDRQFRERGVGVPVRAVGVPASFHDVESGPERVEWLIERVAQENRGVGGSLEQNAEIESAIGESCGNAIENLRETRMSDKLAGRSRR